VSVSLAKLLEGDPDEVVVYVGAVATRREELRTLVDAFTGALREASLEGGAIGVLGANTTETIAAWFAVWNVDGAFVPLNPRVPPTERARAMETTGVAAVLDVAAGSLRMLAPAQPRRLGGGEAIIQFTSGTTGPPKAVPLRHDTIQGLLDGVIGTLRGKQPGERARMPNLVPVSLSLWAGIYQVLFAFTLGVPVVLMEQFSPGEFARLVREHGIRSSVLPPAALVMLLQDPDVTSLEPLRYVRSVSAPLSPTHARAFHERFGVAILNGYGQTELGGEVLGWSAADWKQFGPAKLGAVGRPHAGIEVRVHDDELQVRSVSARTDEGGAVDAGALGDRLTDDGWLRTGDLARIDEDGFVWIEGRVSSMINRGGLKVFPDEVEEHLREFPGVRDAAVAGVPDERLGEVPWAFLVVAPGASLDADALRTWCRERMAPYKIPAGVTFLDELPRNEIGKLLRQDLTNRSR
jgi:acyl-CoA synthetase (AMP-forming)/AMP-acid ligase II